MPVLIIRDERDVRELGSRLLGRADAGEPPDHVVAALREANPQVDLEDLRPGTVLRVPDVEDVRVRDAAVPEELLEQGIAGIVETLDDVVGTLRARSDTHGKAEAADRATVRRTLELKAVKDAAERDEILAANLERARGALAAADQAADDAAAARKESVAIWSADLEAIAALEP